MSIQYLHPYIQTNIYDDSEVYATTVSSNTVLFQPYFSERGVSDTLEMFSDLSAFLKSKGNPNYRKYGQSMYNIVQWLKSGGRVLGIRLTAENASYANIGLNVRTKTEEISTPVVDADGNPVLDENGNAVVTTEKKVNVKLETVTIPNLQEVSDDSIQIVIDEFENSESEDGYKNHIVFLVRSKGKGVYGNNISIRLSENKSYNKTYDFKSYNLTVVQTKNTGTIRTVEGPTAVSLYPDAVTMGGSSLAIQQIIEEYFNEVSCFFNESAYDNLIDEIMTYTEGHYDNTGAIDFIFGDDMITVDNSGAASLFSYTGSYLENGDDGDLAGSKSKSKLVMEQLLINAYNGTLTNAVFDKRQYPIDVVLDFNTSSAVKIAINDFVNQRGDCVCMIDTCEQASATSTVNWKKTNLIIDDYLSSIWSQMFKIYDTYTSQDIYVTPTYFLANKIPAVDRTYGLQQPFVGPNRGIITGFKSINWSPTEDEKENLYENRINYIEQDYRNTKFMSQLTAQSKTTSLSDINHVRVMLQIVRSVEELMENFIFELATDETISRINSALSNLLTPWVTNGTCTTCTGTCSQTALEAEEKIAHVTVNLVFVDVIERIIIDINVTR